MTRADSTSWGQRIVAACQTWLKNPLMDITGEGRHKRCRCFTPEKQWIIFRLAWALCPAGKEEAHYEDIDSPFDLHHYLCLSSQTQIAAAVKANKIYYLFKVTNLTLQESEDTSRVCWEKNNRSLNVLLPVDQDAFWSHSCAVASLTESKSFSSPSPTTSWWT